MSTRVRLLSLLAAVLLTSTACGGDADRRQAPSAAEYAARVQQVSTRTGERLAQLADRADYQRAAPAASSTEAYAETIRAAASELRAVEAPAAASKLHSSLVQLYDQTARGLDALAARFAAAGDPVELAGLAQELSTEIQGYGSREQLLRTAIERAIGLSPQASSPEPVTTP